MINCPTIAATIRRTILAGLTGLLYLSSARENDLCQHLGPDDDDVIGRALPLIEAERQSLE